MPILPFGIRRSNIKCGVEHFEFARCGITHYGAPNDAVSSKGGITMSAEPNENKNEAASTVPPTTEEAKAAQKYDRSTIEFPYGDLDDAVEIVKAVHSNAGISCTLDQLAAFVHQSMTSGAFRLRLSNARAYGLTENERGEVRLTDLGRTCADPAQEPRARVDAFLHVPLYSAIHDKYRGFTLPPAAALEREMVALGVAPKQTGKARQAFMRSARQAGFFVHGEDRLVRPSFNPTPTTRPIDPPPPPPPNKTGGGGGDGGDEGPRHRLIVGLFESLPKDGDTMTAEDAADWLETAAANLRLVYKFKGRIRVAIDGDIPIRSGGSDAA
jgi:hypothetical protein